MKWSSKTALGVGLFVVFAARATPAEDWIAAVLANPEATPPAPPEQTLPAKPASWNPLNPLPTCPSLDKCFFSNEHLGNVGNWEGQCDAFFTAPACQALRQNKDFLQDLYAYYCDGYQSATVSAPHCVAPVPAP